MPLLINLRQIEIKDVVLVGELPVAELDIAGVDECVEVSLPIKYDLKAELMENAILVQGRLALELRCTCVRCLKVFTQPLDMRDWAAHLVREGEGAVPIVNDMIDLTPILREDILLEFPQHPLCEPGCQGLPNTGKGGLDQVGGARQEPVISPAWDELNKLKL